MKRIFRNEKGYINLDDVIGGIFIFIILAFFIFGIYRFVYSRIVGNKTAIDMNYTFKKAIVCIADKKIELKVKSWKDYDGEQLQIVTEDGKVYLVSTFNTILISE